MVYELALQHHNKLDNVAPYPAASQRELWEGLEEDYKKALLENGEAFLPYSFPSISATDFMSYTRTGNRTVYEEKSFAKRQALNALVLAECVEYKGRFLDSILNGIFSLCEESAWQLPAHNSPIRDTPAMVLPDSTEPILDLFACETGSILAVVDYLLKEALLKISPLISKRIYAELEKRIFFPYIHRHFWWMGNGSEPLNNWTVWCTQNVLLSAFLTPQSHLLRSEVFLKAARSIDDFLRGYGEDGCCEEGAQYYRHAGLCLFQCMEILNKAAMGKFNSCYESEKIKNIASYILNVHASGEYYINFADCSPKPGRAGVREYLFGKRTGNKDLSIFAALDYKETQDKLMKQENNLYYRLQAAFTHQEILSFDTTGPICHPQIFYPSTGLFVARDSRYCLAVKAGSNGDSHNHNDTGSFTIYKNGQPLLIDIGVESYTKKTFSPERYDIWTMQSDYHNLPTINGLMQKDGKEYQAADVETSFGTEESFIKMDLAPAYPGRAGIRQYIRKVLLRMEREILVMDTAVPDDEGIPPIVLNLITYEPPVLSVSQNQAKCLAIGSLAMVEAAGADSVSIEKLPITDPRLRTAWKHDIYRIRLSLSRESITLRIHEFS